MHAQHGMKPMLACVMSLTDKRAAALRAVPGVVITDTMRELLAREQDVSQALAARRGIERLALQIVGLRLMGYAGAHVSGVHTLDELLLLEQALIAQRDRITSLAEWLEQWHASWRMPGAPQVGFTPTPAHGNWGGPTSPPPVGNAFATRCSRQCIANSSAARDGSAKPLAGA